MGGNGGNGSGALGAAGRCEFPPEVEFFTVELTVDRATTRAELELVTPVAVVLVRRSTRRDDVLRMTILRLAWPALCTRGPSRSRSCREASPLRADGPASPKGVAASVGVETMTSSAGTDGAGGGKAAVISTAPALTVVGASAPGDDG